MGFHLSQRPPFLDRGFDAIADDRQHVTVLEDVVLVAHAAVPRHDIGATFLVVARHHQVQHAVEARDDARHRTSARTLDDGIPRRVEEVPGRDDVGAAEVDEAVAVAVRCRHVGDDNRLVVEEHPALRQRVGGIRPCDSRV